MNRGTSQQLSTTKDFKDTLWKAAEKLRGSLSARQYKDVILGLVFLKYVSDAQDEREEQQGNGFVVPPSAHWKRLASKSTSSEHRSACRRGNERCDVGKPRAS